MSKETFFFIFWKDKNYAIVYEYLELCKVQFNDNLYFLKKCKQHLKCC